MITLKVDDKEIRDILDTLSRRFDDMTPAMRRIANQLEATVKRNFREGGRPEKWKPSKRVVKRGGKRVLIETRPGQILRKTGRLRNSITRDYGRAFAEVGTSVEYAPTHQFGARKGEFGRKTVTIKAHRRKVKSRDIRKGRRLLAQGVAFVKEHQRIMEFPWGDIPARPFMVVPDEDMEDIKDILVRFILK